MSTVITSLQEQQMREGLRSVLVNTSNDFKNAGDVYDTLKTSMGQTSEAMSLSLVVTQNFGALKLAVSQHGLDWIVRQVKDAWGMIKGALVDFWDWLKEFASDCF